MRWATSGNGWRLARSLTTLGRQLSDIWPQGHPADGTIGDAAHASRRSDHNPNAANVVTALDMGEVVENQGAQLVAALVTARDARVKYIIHESQIWRSYDRTFVNAWSPSPYTGSNPHSNHVHISVSADWRLYDLAAPWILTGLTPGGTPMAGMTVEDLQEALNAAGQTDQNGDALVVDGDYGPKTKAAHVKGLSGSGSVSNHVHSGYAPIAHTHDVSGTAT